MTKSLQFLQALIILLFSVGAAQTAEPVYNAFHGVVTYHLIPAKVLRVNEIIENPTPGTSYIGAKSILVELDDDIEARANWTVVDIVYSSYPEPKVIRYDLFGEQHEVTVEYHARSAVIDGDISKYIEQ